MERPALIDSRLATDPVEKGRQPTVFIVDDEPMVGEVLGVVLNMEGFNTRLFTSPSDAWEAFEAAAEKPELLITDHLMTPFGGLDLIARCRQHIPSLRAILYCGATGKEGAASDKTKPDAFLSKPFLPRELIQTVHAVFARA